MPRTPSKRTVKKHKPQNCPELHIKNCPGCGRSCSCYDKKPVPLYTPVSRVHAGPSQEERDEKTLIKTVRSLLTTVSQPLLRKHARDGVRLFNYMYNATKAAENGAVAPFKGLEIEPVTVTTSTKRGRNAMAVVEIMNTVILEQLRSKEFLNKIQRGGTETK